MKPICLPLLMLLLAPASQADTVVLGAEDDWYPYSGVRNGQAAGMAEDIIRAAFAASGIRVVFKPLPYARCLADAREGRLPGCFNVVRTTLRAPFFLWPARPLYRASIHAYALAGPPVRPISLRDLEGTEVGITNRYEYGERFDLNTRIRKNSGLQDIEGFRKLQAGRVRYMIAYEKVATALFRQHPEELGKHFVTAGRIDQPALYLAFSRHHPDSQRLCARFNRGFARIVKDGRYDAILARWR